MSAGYEFEGLWRRFVAALIDNAGWFLAFSWTLSAFPVSTQEDPDFILPFVFIFATAWFNYFSFCEWRWGQTAGKAAMRERVISADRGKISFGQASLRNLLRLVDFFVIGWIMIATDERHQRLGDKAAHTVVVRTPRSFARNYTLPADPPVPGPAVVPIAGAAGPAEMPPPSADALIEPGPETGGRPARGNLPEIGWDIRDTVRWLIGGLLLAFLLVPLLVLPFDPNLDSAGGLLAAQGLLGATLIVVSVGVASNWRFSPLGEALRRLGLRRVGLKAFGIALLMLLVYYVAAAIFAALVLNPEQEDIASELGVDDPSTLVAVSAVLLIAVLAPLSEELFFRGMVFSGLRSRYSLWPAAVIAGLLFGLPHVFTGPLAVIPLTALGVGLAWLYDRTGSLWPCIFAHVINNSLALALTS